MTTSKKSVRPSTHPHTQAAPVSRFRDAYDRYAPAMKALDEASVAIVNIDIPSAATTAIGAMPEIIALRAEIVETLPKFDIHSLDRLEGYALATLHAHALYMAAAAPVGEIAKLSEDGTALRDTLYVDATTLARHGFVDGQRLSQVKTVAGYKNVALDLMTLAAVLREAWPKIQGKSAIELATLDRAEALADQIITAVGAREQAPAAVAEVAQMRARAFTLFVKAYDKVRRAIGFVRWDEGDLDTIAPSLYAGRGRRAKSDAPTAPAPTDTTPTPSPVAPIVHAAPGLPGGSPFANA